MNEGQITIMAQRLGRLERSHRRWKFLTSGLLGILALISLMGAGSQKAVDVVEEVRAQRILLVDQDGKPRAELAVEKGWSGLRLKDANGRVRALLVVEAEGPILELRDATGRARTTMGIGRHGQSIIQQNIIRPAPRSRFR